MQNNKNNYSKIGHACCRFATCRNCATVSVNSISNVIGIEFEEIKVKNKRKPRQHSRIHGWRIENPVYIGAMTSQFSRQANHGHFPFFDLLLDLLTNVNRHIVLNSFSALSKLPVNVRQPMKSVGASTFCPSDNLRPSHAHPVKTSNEEPTPICHVLMNHSDPKTIENISNRRPLP